MTPAILRHPALRRWPIFAEDRLPLALWSAAEIAAATGGTASGDFQCAGVEMDSRDVRNGDLFVALRGEAMDGHAFLDAAFAAGDWQGRAAAELGWACGKEADAGEARELADDAGGEEQQC